MELQDRRGIRYARDFLSRVWSIVHGAPAEPMTYVLVIALFRRALGVIYFLAFASLAVQMPGLYGSQGILPIADYIATRGILYGPLGVWLVPSVFWLNTSDAFIQTVPIVGALLSLLLLLDMPRVPFVRRALLVALFVLYLSLVAVGQDFLSFQWDHLLLEVGFLAIFLGDGQIVLWLYRWLLFRLMFLSGLVKILSGDPTWRNLTALDYHFETQPLPNVVGWYVHHLPSGVHRAMTAATFFIELVVPFLIFAPRRLRFGAAAGIALLHLQIFITGNYNFFNLLSMALCLLLLDDVALRVLLPARVSASLVPPVVARSNRLARGMTHVIAAILFVISTFQMLSWGRVPTPGLVAWTTDLIEPFRIVNVYGPFAVMTTWRPEIVIEGSNDGVNWLAYEFKYKPGEVRRAPPWVAPHQPRLDWQMWFAALRVRTGDPRALLPSLRANPAIWFYLQNYGAEAWFVNFLVRLLEGSPPVLALLDKNPFPNAPPRFIRAHLYNYRFSAFDAPFTTGEWWTREEQGLYFPPLTLGKP